MQKTVLNVFGLKVDYQEPTTVREFDQLAKDNGACLRSAIKLENHRMHSDIRTKVCDLLEAKGFGTRQFFYEGKPVERKTEKTNGEEVHYFQKGGKRLTDEQVKNVTWENDSTFFERMVEAHGGDRDKFQEVMQEAADLCPFNPARRIRTVAGERQAGKMTTEIATQLYDTGGAKRAAEELSKTLGRTVDISGERDHAINTLALAIGDRERAAKKQRREEYLSLGGGKKKAKAEQQPAGVA